MKLQSKFALASVGLIVIVIFGIAGMNLYSERQLLKSEALIHYQEITSRLAKVCEESLYQNELILFNYIQELKKERGFSAAYFQTIQGKIHMHSDPTLIGSSHPTTPLDNKKGDKFQSIQIEGETYWDFYHLVQFGNSTVGVVHLTIDESVVDLFINASMKKSIKRLIPICFIALGIGLLGAFILAHTMARPISLIVQSIRDVANGHLEPLPLINRKDEIGSIAVELNKTIARLKELDDMKREFIASVTHELRSPLTAIERFVSLTLKGTYGPLSPEQQETLLTVKNNTIRLSSFIDDVLTSAKLEE